jgi:hypothetical protein
VERRLLLDKDSGDNLLVALLAQLGWRTVRAADEGWDQLTDEDLLTMAAERGLTVYTANRVDFARLHARWLSEGRQHSGVLLRAPQWASPERQLRALVSFESDNAEGWTDLLGWISAR